MFTPIETLPRSRRSTTCQEKCLQDRIKSETECKTDFKTNRTQFLNCSRDNAIEYNDCLSECSPETTSSPEMVTTTGTSCGFICTREQLKCQGLCRLHPFQDEWDREECTRECEHETEVCRKICEDSGKASFLSLPKNAELIFSSFSFFHVVVLEGCVFLAMR